MYFHFKDIQLHSSFATAKNFLFRFVKASYQWRQNRLLLSVGCGVGTSPGIGLLPKGRGGRRGRSGTELPGLVPGEPNLPLPRGHCCSSYPGLAGLCTSGLSKAAASWAFWALTWAAGSRLF